MAGSADLKLLCKSEVLTRLLLPQPVMAKAPNATTNIHPKFFIILLIPSGHKIGSARGPVKPKRRPIHGPVAFVVSIEQRD